jgi:hypothetical protein
MRTLFVRPTQDWPVLGLQGQKLGSIVRCALDAGSGRLKYLELQTPWQTIHLDWPHLEFDEHQQSFKVSKHIVVHSRSSQASDDIPDSGSCDS